MFFQENLDFKESLNHSPMFKRKLSSSEKNVDKLKFHLDQIIQHNCTMQDTFKVYQRSLGAFVQSINELTSYFVPRQDSVMSNGITLLICLLKEVCCYHENLLKNINQSITKYILDFTEDQIQPVFECKRAYEKLALDLDTAFLRNANISKTKPNDCIEVSNSLRAIQSYYGHAAIDYVYQFISIISNFTSYFTNGTEYFLNQRDDIQKFSSQIDLAKELSISALNEMEEGLDSVRENEICSSSLNNQNFHSYIDLSQSPSLKMSGYLFKRSSGHFKSWNRRWFVIQNNQLVYYKINECSSDDSDELRLTIMENDLRLCTVKECEDIDRRFCFEVISPLKSHVLQTDSSFLRASWIKALQVGISEAFTLASSKAELSGSSRAEYSASQVLYSKKSSLQNFTREQSSEIPDESLPPSISKVLSLPGNDFCCDCGRLKPEWASINLGITLCIECSAIHRSLGVHFSKVRSLFLDDWDAEHVKILYHLGNTKVNTIYLAKSPNSLNPACSRDSKETWIKQKYVLKSFLPCTACFHAKMKEFDECPPTLSSSFSTPSLPAEVDGTCFGSFNNNSNNANALLPSTTFTKGKKVTALLSSQNFNQSYSETYVQHLQKCVSSTQAVNYCKHPSSRDDDDNVNDDQTTRKKLSYSLPLRQAISSNNITSTMYYYLICDKLSSPNIKLDQYLYLHATSNNKNLVVLEFLLLNGFQIDCKNDDGETLLHLACKLGNTGLVCHLIKKGADIEERTTQGQSALTIAIENENADIVTLLRVGKLRSDDDDFFREDKTFTEVFNDFKNLCNSTSSSPKSR